MPASTYQRDHLADSHFDIASVAQHVCPSPSRLSHLFQQSCGALAYCLGAKISVSASETSALQRLMPIASVSAMLIWTISSIFAGI
ncbi:hypothetical protein KCP71_01275 [Salmonella enterica subsp. enterica]|nr:hypothetical protein KCP71_01275 [Salmonella enterica subsp. enterica]